MACQVRQCRRGTDGRHRDGRGKAGRGLKNGCAAQGMADEQLWGIEGSLQEISRCDQVGHV